MIAATGNSSTENFSPGLLSQIARKASLFPFMGIVDFPVKEPSGSNIIAINTSNLTYAMNKLQTVKLEATRWYINLENANHNRLAFAYFLELTYQSLEYDPTVYIEYVCYDNNPWLELKKSSQFIVSCFSIEPEKYILKTAISGNNAVETYVSLLISATSNNITLENPYADIPTKEFERTATTSKPLSLQEKSFSQPGNPIIASRTVPWRALHSKGITLVYSTLWNRLRDDEKTYLDQRIQQGDNLPEFFALLMNLSDTRFIDLQMQTDFTTISKEYIKILQTTLPEDKRDKKRVPLTILAEDNWNDSVLLPIYRKKIEQHLTENKVWTEWLMKQIVLPLKTIKEWQIFLEVALELHESKQTKFISHCGYQVIGKEEHLNYSKRLNAAQRIVSVAEMSWLQFYLLTRRNEHQLLQQINSDTLIILFSHNELYKPQFKNLLAFLQETAVAYNRLERPVDSIETDITSQEFRSTYLEANQSKFISRHLKQLLLMLSRLPDSEIYLKALIDAYHEIRYKGHNPSISVHNVLMDNKYQIYHRDVNFVRLARRSAKQIDVLIEEHADVVREKIVDEIKEYLFNEYQRIFNPKWDKDKEEKSHVVTYRTINLNRVDELLKRLNELNNLFEWERRALFQLQSILRSARRYIYSLPDKHDFFEENLQLTLWDERDGDPKIMYPGLESLVSRIVNPNEIDIESLDPFTRQRGDSENARLTIFFRAPYEEISLHKALYPVYAKEYLNYYGKFILKLSNETISAIEKEAEQLRLSREQVILITSASNGLFVGTSNDKVAHFKDPSLKKLQQFVEDSTVVNEKTKGNYTCFTNLNEWLQNHHWIIEVNNHPESFAVIEFLEQLYTNESLQPQEYITYVGYPDAEILQSKARKGYIVRAGANTKSIVYWPAIGFPEIHRDLPHTYINLLDFALRYPGKLISLINLIRKTGHEKINLLKEFPNKNADIQSKIREIVIGRSKSSKIFEVDQVYKDVASTLHSQEPPHVLTEHQKYIIDLYINIFREISALTEVKVEMLKKIKEFEVNIIYNRSNN